MSPRGSRPRWAGRTCPRPGAVALVGPSSLLVLTPRPAAWPLGLPATAAVLFVLVTAQTGIGHAITDNGSDWLIGVHVPLAVIIYGAAVRLSIQTATHVRNRPHSARGVVPGRTDT